MDLSFLKCFKQAHITLTLLVLSAAFDAFGHGSQLFHDTVTLVTPPRRNAERASRLSGANRNSYSLELVARIGSQTHPFSFLHS